MVREFPDTLRKKFKEVPVSGGPHDRRISLCLFNLQRQLSRLNLLRIDELGFISPSQTGAELLFEVFRQLCERGSTVMIANLPSDQWTEVFASERLTGALLDRLTHHVHVLEMNGESYRLKRSRGNAAPQAPNPKRSRRRIGRTVNSVSSCSCNVATLPDVLPSVITSVVRDSAAPVAQLPEGPDRERDTHSIYVLVYCRYVNDQKYQQCGHLGAMI